MHTLVVRDHAVSCPDPDIVQHSKGHDAIQLDLDAEWDGLDVSIVMVGPDYKAVEVLYTGEPVTIPASVCEDPRWLPVGIVGYGDGGNVRVLTARADRLLKVVPSGPFEGGEPIPDPPDVLGQLLEARDEALEAAERAESSADDADEAASKASLAADDANAAADRAGKAADLAEDATEAANVAAERAEEAAQAAGEKSLYAYADPDNDELIILEYPAFLESEDGGSVYLTLEGSDN